MTKLQRSEARRDLSEFLRDRRSRIQPQDVGLPHGARRRTPGLRREEVAQLTGVSATWYTWFEQGRDIRVSSTFVERVADALRLDPDQRNGLFDLAGVPRPPEGALTLPAVVPARAEIKPAESRQPCLSQQALVVVPVAPDRESARISQAIRRVVTHVEEGGLPLPSAPAITSDPPGRYPYRVGVLTMLVAALMLLPYSALV